jgi:hypothetical protein
MYSNDDTQGSGSLVHLCQHELALVYTFRPLRKPMAQSPNETTAHPTSFTMAHLAALLDSGIARGYSNNECQAVARALLRHNAHVDGTHYQTRTFGGLHPSFVGFNPLPSADTAPVQSNRELVEASLKDVFDAVSPASLFTRKTYLICTRLRPRIVWMEDYQSLFVAQAAMHLKRSVPTKSQSTSM